MIELAALNHGAVASAELRRSGISRSSVATRVHAGFFVRVAKGVYVLPAMESALTILAAAQLALPVGAISHRTAARLHDMRVGARGLHLTCPPGAHHAITGVRVHESRRLESVDICLIDGLRVTTPARTLWDLANDMGENLHRDLIQEQLIKSKPTKDELIACHRAMARQGRKGTTRMREQLLLLLDDQPFPESELERRVLTELKRRDAPPLLRQFKPPWYDGVRGIVDFADPIGKTILEADGRRWHASEAARRSDLRRDVLAGQHGWFVYRIGWQEVVHRTDSIMDDVVALVAARHAAAQVV